MITAADNHWLAIGWSLVAGIATGLGALPVFFKKEFSKASLDVGLGFSAGIMLVASFISLVLPGIAEAEKVYGPRIALLPVLVGLAIGYFGIDIMHKYWPHRHPGEIQTPRPRASRFMLIVLAICLHNFPEGLAVGVGFGGHDARHGIALALAIAFQNMPEGLVVALALISEGASHSRAFAMAFLSGLIEPVAAILGFISTRITMYSLPVAMGFAGGAMLFVICQEIFPELFRPGHEKKASLGFVIGILLMFLLDFFVAP